jgi:hypothetical protein
MSALRMGRYWLRDKETVVAIGAAVSAAPVGNTPSHWNLGHMLVQRYKDDPASRRAIPAMAAYIRNKANTRPYRGFFSDGAQYRAMEVMDAQWDAEVEAIPDVVPGLSRAYVRVPHHKYKGWVRTRDYARKLLERCGTRASARAVRATVAEERKWLAGVDDAMLKVVTETKAEEARPNCRRFLSDLEAIAAEIEAGR